MYPARYAPAGSLFDDFIQTATSLNFLHLLGSLGLRWSCCVITGWYCGITCGVIWHALVVLTYLRHVDETHPFKSIYPSNLSWDHITSTRVQMSSSKREIRPAPNHKVEIEYQPPPKRKRTNVRVACNHCRSKKVSVR